MLSRHGSQDDAEDIRPVDGGHPVQRYLDFMHGFLDICSQGTMNFVEVHDALYPRWPPPGWIEPPAPVLACTIHLWSAWKTATVATLQMLHLTFDLIRLQPRVWPPPPLCGMDGKTIGNWTVALASEATLRRIIFYQHLEYFKFVHSLYLSVRGLASTLAAPWVPRTEALETLLDSLRAGRAFGSLQSKLRLIPPRATPTGAVEEFYEVGHALCQDALRELDGWWTSESTDFTRFIQTGLDLKQRMKSEPEWWKLHGLQGRSCQLS